ncbi:histone H4-like TAF Taf6, SAGA complex subunit [Tilletia horrida]|uniref:Histone H4-like TAF Taf6, SAGA complex subunit n=1 Tax=Tilletia horrida TaxID=155126 RepID=A0AAN6GS40_9BASI|nr:histone H4-like TAF Taf6, SAGA complex subunit [Tilletia horrida]
MPARGGGGTAADANLGGNASTSSASSSILYPTDSIKDAAEALGIPPLRDNVAIAFAADVEYRLREIIQEAAKYMRHSKRGALSTQDIELALRARNVEPIYGFLPFSTTFHPRSSANLSTVGGTGTVGHPTTLGPTFRRIQTPSGPIHYVADEEIDFERILDAAPKLAKGKGVGWEAHWLAIEGVVPDVPQNVSQRAPTAGATSAGASAASGRMLGASGPLPDSLAGAGPVSGGGVGTASGGAGSATIGAGTAQIKPLIKHVLSRELQLYFERLTTAIVNPPASADVEDDEADDAEIEDGQPKTTQSQADSDPDIIMVDATGARIGDGPTGDANAQNTNATNKPKNAQEALVLFSRRSSGNAVRDAALASLRSDPGLHPLLPYLVQWIGEKVTACLRGEWTLAPPSTSAVGDSSTPDVKTAAAGDTVALRVMLNVIHAMSSNDTLYIEPYLHQLLPTVLSVLLCASLSPPGATQTAYGPSAASTTRIRLTSSSESSAPAIATAHAQRATYQLRSYASALLGRLVETHARAYPGLRPRIVRTLLKALTAGLPSLEESTGFGDGPAFGSLDVYDGDEDVLGNPKRDSTSAAGATGPKESPGTKLGALLALRRIGKEAARLALFGAEADMDGESDDGIGGASLRSRRKSDLLKRVGEWTRRYERSSAYGMGQLGRLRVKEEVAALTREVKACILAVFPTGPTSRADAGGSDDPDVQALEQPLAISLQASIGPFWAERHGSDEDVQLSLLGRTHSQ